MPTDFKIRTRYRASVDRPTGPRGHGGGWLAGVLALLLVVSGCKVPALAPIPAGQANAPHMTIEAAQVIDHLARKPNLSWVDGTLNIPALREARKRYRLSATSLSADWNVTLPTASSSAPAYATALSSETGPTPGPNDALYVMTETGAQLLEINPTTGATINTWTPLSGLASPGTVQKSAILLADDNSKVYMVTTGGYFVVVNATTGARLFAQKISNAGFSNNAPYIDYSNGGVSANENVYMVSNDGSLFRVYVSNGTYTVTAWPSSNGSDKSLWTTANKIAYGAAVSVKDFPVVWNSQAFFGDAKGNLYRVDVSNAASPTLTTWPLAQFTSSSATAIAAPPAIDFDPTTLAVTDIFVPCGDRLDWIGSPNTSPAVNGVTPSPPLLEDKTTPTQGLLSAYSYSSTVSKGPYYCTDWIDAAANTTNSPSVWGDTNGLVSKSPDGIWGAAGYTSTTDGDDCLGYMRFNIPVGDFTGGTPVAANINLSAMTANAGDTVSVYPASEYLHNSTQLYYGAGTREAFWLFGYTMNVTAANRPDLTGGAIGTYTGAVTASSASTGLPRYSIPLTANLPIDANTVPPYTFLSLYSVAIKSSLARSAATEWYKGVNYLGGTNNTEPTLNVTVLGTVKCTTTIQCQASIDANSKKVWVCSSNALHELDYSSSTNYASKASTIYNLTAAGRGLLGAAGTVSSNAFLMPVSNVAYDLNRLLVVDSDPANTRFFLNDFKAPLSSTSDQLTSYYNAGAASGAVGQQLLYDFAGGSVFMTSTAGKLYRVTYN